MKNFVNKHFALTVLLGTSCMMHIMCATGGMVAGMGHGFEIGETMRKTGADFQTAAEGKLHKVSLTPLYNRQRVPFDIGMRIATELQGIHPATPS